MTSRVVGERHVKGYDLRSSKRCKEDIELPSGGDDETETEVTESETETESVGQSELDSEASYKGPRVEYLYTEGRYVVQKKKDMDGEKEQDRISVRVGGDVRSGAIGGALPEPTMSDFLKFYVEDQQKRLEADRAERRYEAERQIVNQQKVLEAMLARTETVDTSPPVPTVRLPTLQEGGDVESFVRTFETVLKVSEIPERLWKRELVSHIPIGAISKMGEIASDRDSTYEDLVCALRGSVALSFGSAAEDFFSGEKGSVWELEVRSSLSRLKYLVKAIAGDADSIDDVAERMAVAAARDHLNPSLRTIIDTGMHFTHKAFVEACEQWAKAQPRGTACFRRPRSSNPMGGKPGSTFPQGRKPVNCFNCGKSGHISRECRSRPQGEAATAPVVTAAQAAPTAATIKSEVVCFRCRAKGHKSPDCPSRPKGNRRVEFSNREPIALSEEELFGDVNSCATSITIDTGAQISIVPRECVLSDQWTGNRRKVRGFQGAIVEGEECRVQFTIGGRKFDREAVAVEGEMIHWTPCLRVPLRPREELDFLLKLAKEKEEKDTVRYQPPRMVRGKLRSGFMVSGGDLNTHTTTPEHTPQVYMPEE